MIGDINITMLSINIKVDSCLDISLTNNPATACVIAATSARTVPNFISTSGLIMISVKINPNINMWELSRPLIDKWINDTYDPFKVLEEWFHKNKIALLKIPEIINKFDEFISKK